MLIGFIVVVLELKRILEIEVNISFYTSGIHELVKRIAAYVLSFKRIKKTWFDMVYTGGIVVVLTSSQLKEQHYGKTLCR